MQKLFSISSQNIANEKRDKIPTTKTNLDYAYGQLATKEKSMKNLNTSIVTGRLHLNVPIFELPICIQRTLRYTDNFSGKNEHALEWKDPDWLDHDLALTEGNWPIRQKNGRDTEELEKFERIQFVKYGFKWTYCTPNRWDWNTTNTEEVGNMRISKKNSWRSINMLSLGNATLIQFHPDSDIYWLP